MTISASSKMIGSADSNGFCGEYKYLGLLRWADKWILLEGSETDLVKYSMGNNRSNEGRINLKAMELERSC